MPIIDSKEKLLLFVALLLPGFIIASIRNRYVIRRNRSGYDEILAYVLGSAISHAIGSPLWGSIFNGTLSWIYQAIFLVILLLIIPTFVGFGWSYLLQHNLLERFAPSVGLSPVHHAGTAWDWKFEKLKEGEWILVTLKNGTQHAGQLTEGSFVASSPAERDLYIGQVYDIGEGDEWTHPGRTKSILIPYSEVSTIVFWPKDHLEQTNVDETGA